MFKIVKKEIEWGGETLSIETGKIARQADGAIIIRHGDTSILCTAVAAKKAKADLDFFPLTVTYQEKAFAAGKIPGGFFKREGRPGEKETLTSRLIDRPIRPLFPGSFQNETHIVCTVISYDHRNDSDIIALIGASAALAISGIPFNGPVAAARVAFVNGEYVLNPFMDSEDESKLDLVVAGTESSVMMVESEVDELTEEQMLGAVEFAHEQIQPVIAMINDLAKECGKPRWEVAEVDNSAIEEKVSALAKDKVTAAYGEIDKQTRSNALADIRDEVQSALLAEDAETNTNDISSAIKKLEKKVVRGNILENGARIDGRTLDKVRQIESETDVVPLTHGSALFTRGETQALVVLTLGGKSDEQRIDSLDGDNTINFMLHYNFPPYSVGEARMMRPPGRREIGHGKLAWRALNALMPSREEFPYTIRLVSEITESNGSSSMATVCGSSMALMNAGVPMKRPVAGIAMGLIKEEDSFAVLSDIMGDEDHLGDMDFKVAGTSEGITSLQMDIKIDGITPEIMKIALAQAKDGRLHILNEMAKTIGETSAEMNPNAPKVISMKVHVDKIREVIGSGGKVIKGICEDTGAKVDIEDDGTIRILADNSESAEHAKRIIDGIVEEPEEGKIYDAKVVNVVDFGAFVSIMSDKQGLVHISELADHRVNTVTDIVNEGDEVKVKLVGFDRGKMRLSMRVVNQETGEDLSDTMEPSKAPPKKKKNY